jgi:hypothetical protein
MNRLKSISRADWAALVLSLIAILVCYWIGVTVFEGIPHLEDEFAYVWEGEVIASGQVTLESPPEPAHFLVPFVVDYNGRRFGKYPLGWPALLGASIFLGLRAWINPLLAGFGVWLTYRLGKFVLSETVALLAAFLTLTSPFFLINSGSLLSHPFGLVLSASFALAWLNAFSGVEKGHSSWLPLLVAAFCLGVLGLTRPLTAVAVALPFGVHGLYLLIRGDRRRRTQLLVFGGVVLLVSSLQFVWQFAATGDPFLNLYTLWWKYDKVGFGPGVGRYGHTLGLARVNTLFSLRAGWRDLFGWGALSWIFLPFGVWAVRRNGRALMIGSVYFSLIFVYLAYWVGSWLFGPRYYYEGLYSFTILSAAGIALLAGWPLNAGSRWEKRRGWAKARPLGFFAAVLLLVAGNLIFYTPLRLNSMKHLYGISRQALEPFETPDARDLAPALFIVHGKRWTDYANLLPLESPLLNTPFLFVLSRGPAADARLEAAFPDRNIYQYDPQDPFVFYR